MSVSNEITILSIAILALLSGLLGVLISSWFQKHNELRKAKFRILQQLMGSRYDVNGKEFLGALNQVAIVFCDSKEVLTALNSVAEEVRGANRNADIGHEKILVLFKAILKNLNIKTEPLTDTFFLSAFIPHA